MILELVGLLGYIFILLSYPHQIAKMYHTKKVEDISIKFLLRLWIGLMLIEIYAVGIGDLVFGIGNGIALCFVTTMIELWRIYHAEKEDLPKSSA